MYRGYQNAIAVYVNGVIGIDVENGIYSANTTFSPRAFTNHGGVLDSGGVAANTCTSIVSQNLIDFSSYYTITVKNNAQNLTLDVSGYSGTGYLCVYFVRGNTNNCGIAVAITSAKSNFGLNIISGLATSSAVSENQCTISEITVE